MPTIGSALLMVTSSTAPIAAPHTVPEPPKIATEEGASSGVSGYGVATSGQSL